MTLAPIELPDTEKLHLLQLLDQYREWHSLEEKRYCLVCGNLITGSQIYVVNDGSEMSQFRLVCPTMGCPSIPMDWVVATQEILVTLATRDRKYSLQNPN